MKIKICPVMLLQLRVPLVKKADGFGIVICN